MRSMAATLVLTSVLLASLTARAQAPLAQAAGEPKTTWFFYTVKWGFQDEFLDLFQRNHYPVLKAREKAGYYRSVRTFVPEFHGDGRADWTFAVELVVAPNPPTSPTADEIIAKLYPDRAKFNREEQRRFEILVAHWDVPLNRIDLDKRQPTR
ncbi:MAG TPA: hypothetical protein VH740_27865 [Vicinamibacterales bacterium]|jgi:hypothetical protein